MNALSQVGRIERSDTGGLDVSGGYGIGAARKVAKVTSSSTRPRRLKGAKSLEEFRRLKREYMRQWRADPRIRPQDMMNRLKWHYQRKLRSALDCTPKVRSDACQKPLCGFYHQLPAISTVRRLKCSDVSRNGYVEELVLYCGEC